MSRSYEFRPWGEFKILGRAKMWWAKLLIIKAGEMTSLQTHKKRDELWMCVEGIVEMHDAQGLVRTLKAGEYCYIPRGNPHRLKAKAVETAQVIEVAYGDPKESDIVRLEDKYDRK